MVSRPQNRYRIAVSGWKIRVPKWVFGFFEIPGRVGRVLGIYRREISGGNGVSIGGVFPWPFLLD